MNNSRLNYIPDDGYTETGFVQAHPGLYGELRFAFRPMLPETRSRLLRGLEDVKAEERDVQIAVTLATYIREWDMKDRRGDVLPIKADTIRRIKPALFYRVWGIVMGTDATDMDPQWDEATATEHTETLIEAADGPEPIGDVRQRETEKN